VGTAHRQPRGYHAIMPCASVSATKLELKDCLLIFLRHCQSHAKLLCVSRWRLQAAIAGLT
jgi:hypothetical protein